MSVKGNSVEDSTVVNMEPQPVLGANKRVTGNESSGKALIRDRHSSKMGEDAALVKHRQPVAAVKQSNMYAEANTWNPFKGCKFDCTYCIPSFQLQAKRQKHNCSKCYSYEPHEHPNRLSKFPPSKAKIVFVCGNSDISFCTPDYVRRIIAAIKKRNAKRPEIIYYVQSKKPKYLAQFVEEFPENVILVTTLETNRDGGYRKVSKAPPPSKRYAEFKDLDYPRKVVTIEPIMDFDVDEFTEWIIELKPEYIWLGLNSRPTSVQMPEPPLEKIMEFARRMTQAGINVREKDLRGLVLPNACQLGRSDQDNRWNHELAIS